jgi:hypothetical protein
VSNVKILPGLDGIPFRLGPGEAVPFVKDNDPEHLRPKMVTDVKVKIFNTTKAADMAEYSEIWSKAGRGQVIISAEERHWCDASKGWKIFLRWGEVFLEPAKGVYHDGQVRLG